MENRIVSQGIQITIKWAGLSGIAGALLLFIGDMMFYFSSANPNPGASFPEVMALTTGLVGIERLIISGAMGPIGAWLLTIGAFQMYHALLPAGKRPAIITSFSFAAIMIFFGVFHAAFPTVGFGATISRLLADTGPVAATAVAIPFQYFHALLWVLATPFLVFTASFISTVARGKTLYSRWIILMTPTLLGFLVHALEAITPPASDLLYALYVIFIGGSSNLAVLAFFGASTISLMHKTRTAHMQNLPS